MSSVSVTQLYWTHLNRNKL